MKDAAQRTAVIQAYARSIGTIWLVDTPLVGAGLIMGEFPFRIRGMNGG
jgi:hypothetical protein